MLEFKSLNEFHIKGRGKVFSVSNDRDRDFNDFSDIIGEKVKIDGKIYYACGVEKYAIPTISKGLPIGILVKEIQEITMPKVKITLENKELYPKYESTFASGFDIKSNEKTTLKIGEIKAIKTGIRAQIPKGYEIQVRPRSGLAIKKGVTVLNSPGTIDSDYRGEIAVILINHGDAEIAIEIGDRIAQCVLAKTEYADLELTDKLDDTDRGDGGFGSTGRK